MLFSENPQATMSPCQEEVMRPDSQDTILLMLGTLQKAGFVTTKLPEELVAGLLFEDEDEECC